MVASSLSDLVAVFSRVSDPRKARGVRHPFSGIVSLVFLGLLGRITEGINNNIKVIKRMAYGFRGDEYFFLRIRAAFPGIGR